MNVQQAAALLTVAAAFDNRKPDEDAAKAWAMALGDLPFLDCRDAIVAHYQASSEWLMPAKVITEVRRVRSKRIAEGEGQLTPPPHAREGAALHEWLRVAKRRLGDGESVEDINPSEELSPRHLPDLRNLLPRPEGDTGQTQPEEAPDA